MISGRLARKPRKCCLENSRLSGLRPGVPPRNCFTSASAVQTGDSSSLRATINPMNELRMLVKNRMRQPHCSYSAFDMQEVVIQNTKAASMPPMPPPPPPTAPDIRPRQRSHRLNANSASAGGDAADEDALDQAQQHKNDRRGNPDLLDGGQDAQQECHDTDHADCQRERVLATAAV